MTEQEDNHSIPELQELIDQAIVNAYHLGRAHLGEHAPLGRGPVNRPLQEVRGASLKLAIDAFLAGAHRARRMSVNTERFDRELPKGSRSKTPITDGHIPWALVSGAERARQRAFLADHLDGHLDEHRSV